MLTLHHKTDLMFFFFGGGEIYSRYEVQGQKILKCFSVKIPSTVNEGTTSKITFNTRAFDPEYSSKMSYFNSGITVSFVSRSFSQSVEHNVKNCLWIHYSRLTYTNKQQDLKRLDILGSKRGRDTATLAHKPLQNHNLCFYTCTGFCTA